MSGYLNFFDIISEGKDTCSFSNKGGIVSRSTFGGRILGQTCLVAMRADQGKRVSTLATYFLSPGETDVPMDYTTVIEHQGNSITFVSIFGSQNGKKISQTKATLISPLLGGSVYQKAFPKVSPPKKEPFLKDAHPIMDMSPIEQHETKKSQNTTIQKYIWLAMKVSTDLPVMAIFAYLSDAVLLPSLTLYFGLSINQIGGKELPVASVEHSMFFANVTPSPWENDWILCDLNILLIERGKAYITGDFFHEDGRYIGGATQGGIYRHRGPSKPS